MGEAEIKILLRAYFSRQAIAMPSNCVLSQVEEEQTACVPFVFKGSQVGAGGVADVPERKAVLKTVGLET